MTGVMDDVGVESFGARDLSVFGLVWFGVESGDTCGCGRAATTTAGVEGMRDESGFWGGGDEEILLSFESGLLVEWVGGLVLVAGCWEEMRWWMG